MAARPQARHPQQPAHCPHPPRHLQREVGQVAVHDAHQRLLLGALGALGLRAQAAGAGAGAGNGAGAGLSRGCEDVAGAASALTFTPGCGSRRDQLLPGSSSGGRAAASCPCPRQRTHLHSMQAARASRSATASSTGLHMRAFFTSGGRPPSSSAAMASCCRASTATCRAVLPCPSSCSFWRRLRRGSRWRSSSTLPSKAALRPFGAVGRVFGFLGF